MLDGMARILLVDDEIDILETLGTILKSSGHEVISATNGLQALALFATQAVDLVIIDMVMPEKSGADTIRELRQRNAQVPIIAMSGGGRMEPSNYLDLAREFGATQIFAKPFSNQEFLEAVKKLVPRG